MFGQKLLEVLVIGFVGGLLAAGLWVAGGAAQCLAPVVVAAAFALLVGLRREQRRQGGW